MIIDVDTVADGDYGTTGESAGVKITAGFDVTFTVVAEYGPGGGHPTLRFEGSGRNLRALLLRHYDLDTVDTYFGDDARYCQVLHLIEAGNVVNPGVSREDRNRFAWAVVDAWESEIERIHATAHHAPNAN